MMTDFLQGGLVFLGLILRIAVPLGISFILGRLIYRLDARWKSEAEAVQAAKIMAIELDTSMPCWDVMSCDVSKRRNCPVYKNTSMPCWEQRSNNGHLEGICLSCLYPKIIKASEESFASTGENYA